MLLFYYETLLLTYFFSCNIYFLLSILYSCFKISADLVILTPFSFIFVACNCCRRGKEMPETPRNVLYIMLDDADYYDFGYNNALLDAPDAITPHIDSLRSKQFLFAVVDSLMILI